MTLAIEKIPEGSSLVLDTGPIIYLLEGHPLAARFRPLFAAIDSGRFQAVVTPVTLAEVVTGPLKAGKEALAESYRRTLTTGPSWALRPIDAEIAMLAARIRSRAGLKLPDAIQAAVAVQDGCYALVTHDRDFSRVDGLRVL